MIKNQKIINQLKNHAIYMDCFKSHNLESYKYKDAKDFFNHSWGIYEKYKTAYLNKHGKKINNGINGHAFEIIFGLILDFERIVIDSCDQEIPNIPLVKPDFIIKKKGKNLFISLKVSVRERWKQADWESLKYKKFFTNAKCYLLMNSQQEYPSLKKKLPLLDIDGVFLASSNDINKLISLIK